MKPTAKPTFDASPLLAFGAHPDDIEFGCGGIIARETRAGRKAHFVVCSRGESATHGTPEMRAAEAAKAAAVLGATIEFVELDGDGSLEPKPAHALALADLHPRHRTRASLPTGRGYYLRRSRPCSTPPGGQPPVQAGNRC